MRSGDAVLKTQVAGLLEEAVKARNALQFQNRMTSGPPHRVDLVRRARAQWSAFRLRRYGDRCKIQVLRGDEVSTADRRLSYSTVAERRQKARTRRGTRPGLFSDLAAKKSRALDDLWRSGVSGKSRKEIAILDVHRLGTRTRDCSRLCFRR